MIERAAADDELLGDAWAALVRDPADRAAPTQPEVAVTGSSGRLRSRFRVEDTAVACVGVAVAAASRLHWQPDAPTSLSTVRARETTPAVSVDREHVSAAVVSERHF